MKLLVRSQVKILFLTENCKNGCLTQPFFIARKFGIEWGILGYLYNIPCVHFAKFFLLLAVNLLWSRLPPPTLTAAPALFQTTVIYLPRQSFVAMLLVSNKLGVKRVNNKYLNRYTLTFGYHDTKSHWGQRLKVTEILVELPKCYYWFIPYLPFLPYPSLYQPPPHSYEADLWIVHTLNESHFLSLIILIGICQLSPKMFSEFMIDTKPDFEPYT